MTLKQSKTAERFAPSSECRVASITVGVLESSDNGALQRHCASSRAKTQARAVDLNIKSGQLLLHDEEAECWTALSESAAELHAARFPARPEYFQ